MFASLLNERLRYGLTPLALPEDGSVRGFSVQMLPKYSLLEVERDGSYRISPELLEGLHQGNVFIHGLQEKPLLNLIQRLLARVLPPEEDPLRVATEGLRQAQRFARLPLAQLTFGLTPVDGPRNLGLTGQDSLSTALKMLREGPEALHVFNSDPQVLKSLVQLLLEHIGVEAAYWKVELAWAASALPSTAICSLLDGRLGFGFRRPQGPYQQVFDLARETSTGNYREAFLGRQKIFLHHANLFMLVDEVLNLLLAMKMDGDEARALILSALETAETPAFPAPAEFHIAISFLGGQLVFRDRVTDEKGFSLPEEVRAGTLTELLDQLRAGRDVELCTRQQPETALLLLENAIRQLQPNCSFDWATLARRLSLPNYSFTVIREESSKQLWQLEILPHLIIGCGLGPNRISLSRRGSVTPKQYYKLCGQKLREGQDVELEVNQENYGFVLALLLYAEQQGASLLGAYARFQGAALTGQYQGPVSDWAVVESTLQRWGIDLGRGLLPVAPRLAEVGPSAGKSLQLLLGVDPLLLHEKGTELAAVYQTAERITVYCDYPTCGVFTAMRILARGQDPSPEASELYQKVAQAYGSSVPLLETVLKVGFSGVLYIDGQNLRQLLGCSEPVQKVETLTRERLEELQTIAEKGPLALAWGPLDSSAQVMALALLQRVQKLSENQAYEVLARSIDGFLRPRMELLPAAAALLQTKPMPAPGYISVRSIEEHNAAVQAIRKREPKRLLLHRWCGMSMSVLVGDEVYLFEDLQLQRAGVLSLSLRDLITDLPVITVSHGALILSKTGKDPLALLGFGSVNDWLSHVLQTEVLEPIPPENSRPLTDKEKTELAAYIRKVQAALQKATRL